MLRALSRGSVLGLLALLFAAAGARGQRAHFSLGGGPALPTDNSVDNGFHFLGSVDVTLPAPALAVRLDAQYGRFPFGYFPVYPCPPAGCTTLTGHETVIAGSINGVLQMPGTSSPAVPYLIGGVGMYDHDSGNHGIPSGTDIGLNAGGGLRLRLGSVQAFAEARFHAVKVATNFVPITIGLRF